MTPITFGKLTVTAKDNQLGQERFFVYGRLGPRRVQKFFRDIEPATNFARNENDAYAKLGDTFIGLGSDDRIRLSAAYLRSQDGGYDLGEALTFFEAHRNGNGNGLTVATAAPIAPSNGVKLEEAKKQFRAAKNKAGVKQSTVVGYCTGIDGLIKQAGKVAVADVTKLHIEAHLERYENPTSYNTSLRGINTFLEWCVVQEFIGSNPAAKVERKKKTQRPPILFSIESLKRLLRKVNEVRPEAISYYALCLFAGIRPEEVDRMTADDVSLKEGYIKINDPKTGGYPRVIMIDDCGPLRKWLEPTDGYLPDDGTGGLKWRNWRANAKQAGEHRTLFQKIYKDAGWDKWPKDALRHAFCSYHKHAYSNMELTNQIAGHSMDVSKAHYENSITSLGKPEENATGEEKADNGRLLKREYALKLWSLTPDKL